VSETAAVYEARAAVKPMLEKALQAHVEHAARQLGWLVYHTFDSRRSAAGWPDLVCVHEETGRMIVAELKRDGKKPTEEQRRWLVALAGVPGIECYVWHPSEWESGEIVEMLR